MELLAVIQYLNTMIERGEIGFVAMIVSKFHALGFDAWLQQMRSRGYSDAGVVLLRPQNYRHVVEPSDFTYAGRDTHTEIILLELSPKHFLFGHFPKPFKTLMNYIDLFLYSPQRASHRGTLYIIYPAFVSFDILTLLHTKRIINTYRISFVLIDDLGAHFSQSMLDFSKRTSSKDFLKIFKNRVYILINRLKLIVESQIQKKFLVETRLLFSRSQNDPQLVPNELIVDDYRRIINSIPTIEIPSFTRIDTRPIALVITQPMSESRLMTPTAELRMYQNAILKLCQSYQVVIKPHPSEKPEKYIQILNDKRLNSINIFTETTPAEKLFRYLLPGDIVVGATSTALVTAKVFYQIPAYTLGVYALDQTNVTRKYNEMYSLFRKLTTGLLQDFEELKIN